MFRGFSCVRCSWSRTVGLGGSSIPYVPKRHFTVKNMILENNPEIISFLPPKHLILDPTTTSFFVDTESNLAEDLLEGEVADAEGVWVPRDMQTVAVKTREGEEWSYMKLNMDVNRMANAFVKMGVKRNDRIAINVGNNIFFYISWLATIKVGAIACPLQILSEERWKYFLNDLKPVVLVSDFEIPPELDTGDLQVIYTRNFLLFENFSNAVELMSNESPDFVAEKSSPWKVVNISYTSGTSGHPKGVTQLARNLRICSKQMSMISNFYPGKKVLCPSSLAFTMGLVASLLHPLYSGATVNLTTPSPWCTAPEMINQVITNKIDLIVSGPRYFTEIVNSQDYKGSDFPPDFVAWSAGENLPIKLARDWREKFGFSLDSVFGCSELLTLSISKNSESGNLGELCDSVEFALVNDEGKIVCLEGTGKLAVKGPIRCVYWNNNKEQELYNFGDWQLTGDILKCDRKGKYFFVGRANDLIISKSGENISAIWIEDVLESHASVREAAAIRDLDETGLVIITCFVRTKTGKEESPRLAEELIEYTNNEITPHKISKIVFIEALPKNSEGKLLRRQLPRKELPSP